MPGFDNNVVYANNVDFSGGSPVVGKVVADGQLLIGSTASPNIRVATLTPGTGISITNAAGSITVNATGAGLKWNAIGVGGALVVNNGYVCTAGAALSFSLPAVSAAGDVVALSLDGATSWTITQAAGQQIRFGAIQTTLGVVGTLSSTNAGDTVTLVCSVANTLWNVISCIGTLSAV
jgi:hypothetical protein